MSNMQYKYLNTFHLFIICDLRYIFTIRTQSLFEEKKRNKITALIIYFRLKKSKF